MEKEFDKRVFKILKKIPNGKITTYKEIAAALGSHTAFRAVGNACSKNRDLEKFPCFRVVKSDGSVGGYARGANQKIKLLKKEVFKANYYCICHKKILCRL